MIKKVFLYCLIINNVSIIIIKSNFFSFLNFSKKREIKIQFCKNKYILNIKLISNYIIIIL
jgi:hypothetical protein